MQIFKGPVLISNQNFSQLPVGTYKKLDETTLVILNNKPHYKNS